MNMVTRTAYANLKMNKSRNILTGIAITLTTILMITVFTVGFGMIHLQGTAINKLYPTYHALYRDISRELYEKLSKHAEIQELGMRVDVGKVYENDYNILLMYLNSSAVYLEKVTLEKGDYPRNENEIVVSKGVLDALHMTGDVGDVITIPYQILSKDGFSKSVNREFTISGILPTSKENESRKLYACFVSKTFMENNISRDEKLCQATIRLKNADNMTTDEIEYNVKKIAKNFEIEEQNIAMNSEYLMANYVDPAIYTGIAVIAMVIVIAGVLTIYGIYYVSMIQKDCFL